MKNTSILSTTILGPGVTTPGVLKINETPEGVVKVEGIIGGVGAEVAGAEGGMSEEDYQRNEHRGSAPMYEVEAELEAEVGEKGDKANKTNKTKKAKKAKEDRGARVTLPNLEPRIMLPEISKISEEELKGSLLFREIRTGSMLGDASFRVSEAVPKALAALCKQLGDTWVDEAQVRRVLATRLVALAFHQSGSHEEYLLKIHGLLHKLGCSKNEIPKIERYYYEKAPEKVYTHIRMSTYGYLFLGGEFAVWYRYQ